MLNYSEQNLWSVSSGQIQSPVNILTAKAVACEEVAPKLEFHYQNRQGQKIENPQNLQLGQEKSTAIFNGRRFIFKQVHFHTTSEHQIDNQGFPLEGHFVHQAANGCLAVVAVLYHLGPENTGFQTVLEGLRTTKPIFLTHFAELLPLNKSYYHYRGSLTTPPLVEGVEWYVLKEHPTISTAQLALFTALQGENTRKLQPLNGRMITEYNE